MAIPNMVRKFQTVGHNCEVLNLSSAHACHMVRVNAYNAAGMSRRQDKNVTNFEKMSTFWNLVTVFGILLKNAFERVQTCLVLVH